MIEVKVFAEGVARQMKDYLPEAYQDVTCKVTEQQKNNGTVRIGLLLERPGARIAPIVYMEPLYVEVQKGKPMEQIMLQMAEICERSLEIKALPEQIDMTDYDAVKEYLSIQVINQKANQKLLSRLPHREMEDLAVICRIEFPAPDGEGIGTIKVTEELLTFWSVDQETVYQKALENAEKKNPPILTNMNAILKAGLGMQPESPNLLETEKGAIASVDPVEGLYILRNKTQIDGASVLAYPKLPEQLQKAFPQGCYILPSSVHEVLIVPKDHPVTPKELGEMVREINRQEVAREEVLSDRVYEFDKETGRLCQVPESMERTKERER